MPTQSGVGGGDGQMQVDVHPPTLPDGLAYAIDRFAASIEELAQAIAGRPAIEVNCCSCRGRDCDGRDKPPKDAKPPKDPRDLPSRRRNEDEPSDSHDTDKDRRDDDEDQSNDKRRTRSEDEEDDKSRKGSRKRS